MSIKVKTIYYERTFNLGNYENEKIGFNIEIDEEDNVKECFDDLKQQVISLSEKTEDIKPYKRAGDE